MHVKCKITQEILGSGIMRYQFVNIAASTSDVTVSNLNMKITLDSSFYMQVVAWDSTSHPVKRVHTDVRMGSG